jgi:hypothetical protein
MKSGLNSAGNAGSEKTVIGEKRLVIGAHRASLIGPIRPIGRIGPIGAFSVRSAEDDQNAAEKNQDRTGNSHGVQMNLAKEDGSEEYDEKRIANLQKRGQGRIFLVYGQRVEKISASAEDQIRGHQPDHRPALTEPPPVLSRVKNPENSGY